MYKIDRWWHPSVAKVVGLMEALPASLERLEVGSKLECLAHLFRGCIT